MLLHISINISKLNMTRNYFLLTLLIVTSSIAKLHCMEPCTCHKITPQFFKNLTPKLVYLCTDFTVKVLTQYLYLLNLSTEVENVCVAITLMLNSILTSLNSMEGD